MGSKLIAVLELTQRQPTLVFGRLPQLIDDIWAALRDGRPETRAMAANAARGVLAVIGERDFGPQAAFWHARILDEALLALGANRTEAVVSGALVMLQELMHASQGGRSLDERKLEMTFEGVWAQRESRLRHVRMALLVLLPRLIVAAQPALAAQWLPRVVSHLFAALHMGQEQRAAALLALGQTAVAVGGDSFYAFAPAAVRECADALPQAPPSGGGGKQKQQHHHSSGGGGGNASRSTSSTCHTEALECLQRLAEVHGQRLATHLADVLPCLFHVGLLAPMATTLATLAAHVPSLVPQLQGRLLDAVCHVLTGGSFSEWTSASAAAAANERLGGAGLRLGPENLSLPLSTSSTSGGSSGGGSGGGGGGGGGGGSSGVATGGGSSGASGSAAEDAELVAQVELALQTLGSFDWTGFELRQLHAFVCECVAPYLDNMHAPTRRAAAVTCCRLFATDDANVHSAIGGGHSPPSALGWSDDDVSTTEATTEEMVGANERQLMAETVLERVLIVGVADPASEVRHAVLRELTPAFDLSLAQTGKWELVMLALSDDNVATREAAIAVLGRLARLNPAHLMPALRTQLFDLLTEIEHSPSSVRREDAAHLLGKLVCAAPQLIKPYASTVLRVLQPQVSGSAAALASLGELSVVAGGAVGPSMPQLLPQLLPLLQDQSSSLKRRVALHALSQLLRSTGYPSEHAVYGIASPSALLLSTLLAMLGTEQEPSTRLELLRSLGTLGAPDPSSQIQIQLARQRTASAAIGGGIGRGDLASERSPASDLDDDTIEPTHPDFYPSVALRALTRILRDASLSAQHGMVICAMVGILRSLGGASQCLPFLPVVLPRLLHTGHNGGPQLREVAVEQLGHLIGIIGLHVRGYVPAVLALAQEHLHLPSSIQVHCIAVLEQLCLALCDEFQRHLASLMPKLLAILHSDCTERRRPTLKVLHALGVFDQNLQEHLHLVVPAVLRLCEQHDAPRRARSRAVRLFGWLCSRLDLREYASQLLHGLMRVLRGAAEEERNHVLATLCALLSSLGADFAVFAPPVVAELKELQISHALFDELVVPLCRPPPTGAPPCHPPCDASGELAPSDGLEDPFAGLALRGEYEARRPPLPPPTLPYTKLRRAQGVESGILDPLEDEDGDVEADADANEASPFGHTERSASKTSHGSAEVGNPSSALVDQKNLEAAWEVPQHSTRADYHEWMRRLSTEMILRSPSAAMRACASLAQVYQPLARELFNAAFLSCWSELGVQGYHDSVVRSLETALDADNMSLEVLQPLLNLAEFMELVDKPLPIDICKLGTLAEKCHAYAKALHYREVEFHDHPAETIEALISINNHLQQPEAAKGILSYASKLYRIELKESWYEKLQRWNDALHAYERRQQEDPASLAWTVGRMRCHHALGEWETLGELARQTWDSRQLATDAPSKAEVARLAAAGAWNLRNWQEMARYCASMPEDAVETSLFRAVLAVHTGAFPAAQVHIDQARRQLDSEFTALVGESYHRAYRIMIGVLQLAELEEIILHKQQTAAMPLPLLMRMWQHRIGLVQRDAEVWQDILSVRYLAVPPAQDPRTWLKFCSLCRKAGRSSLSRQLLVQLLGVDPELHPAHDFGSAEPAVVFAFLKQLWDDGSRQQALARMQSFVHEPRSTRDPKLAAKTWLKLGQWQRALLTEAHTLDTKSISVVLQSLGHATDLNPESYKAWHEWAMLHFEAVSQGQGLAYVVPAISGFVRSIALGRERALQDTLRLLTMWFKYGANPAVDEAVQHGFDTIPIDTWLLVTPQIIARIHSPIAAVRHSVHLLLNRVAKAHPQGLIYPLTVASKSMSEPRQSAALRVLQEMRRQCDHLVEQASLVSEELIRTSILWHEMWHAGLEEASRLYFGAKDVEGMLATLKPLHEMLLEGPETMREASFQQAFGQDLQRAHEHCQRYQQLVDRQDLARAELHAAWDIYYHVFRRISKQIAKLTLLELQHVSPKLLEAKDLELALPGTYQAGAPLVRIRSFAATMTVIASKQRPRKLTIHGSDGSTHAFLLKGHEDLRQDERVMQLFGLVNTLLSTDRDTSNKDLTIQRYSVVPLSPNSGLISWVAQCDTLHALIKEYREARKILLNIEHRLMLQMAPDYDALPVLNKLEVFEHTMENTNGHDLARVLWLRSRNAEHWLLRRTTYTRSLAVMSVVGYILGLGDRHPSNLMLDRLTGKILHIDFGDCFEVAVHREKFPEKIPFRLTRMLVTAMEVSGIEGNFRSTCESVISMLRNNKDSVLAMLEAFVHDPLINWRLLVRPSQEDVAGRSRSAADRSASGYGNRQRRMGSDASGGGHVGGRSRSASIVLASEEVAGVLGSTQAQLTAERSSAAHGQTGATSLIDHPASLIGTPHLDAMAADVPESSSVTVSRRSRAEPVQLQEEQDEQALNDRAVSVLRRVKSKLAGSDFPDQAPTLDVATQVNRLVVEAQSDINLCQLYIGWCP